MKMRFITIPALLAPLAAAYTVQDLWIFPTAPDYTSSITAGTTVEFQWAPLLQGMFAGYCPACDTTDVDLWLTGDNNYRRIKAGINIETTHSVQWTVNLDSVDISSSDAWVIRFIPSGADWQGSGQEVSSPQFNVLPASSSSTATVTVTVSQSTTSATTTSTSTQSTESTPTPLAPLVTGTPLSSTGSDSSSPALSNSGKSSDTLSPGAKAGLGIGVTIGALAIMAILFFIWKQRKQTPNYKAAKLPPPTDPSDMAEVGRSAAWTPHPHPQSQPQPHSELPGYSRLAEAGPGPLGDGDYKPAYSYGVFPPPKLPVEADSRPSSPVVRDASVTVSVRGVGVSELPGADVPELDGGLAYPREEKKMPYKD